MSQKFTLYDDLTVDENLSFAASLRQIPEEIFQKRKSELLGFINFDSACDVVVSKLPGGTKQEIALVTSLLHDPLIVFLDEPTAGVAPVARAKFWGLIKQLSGLGKTIFVTTHYMDEAENCDRVAFMRSGELIALDTPNNLKNNTYKEQIYLITANDKEGDLELDKISDKYFSMFEVYGQHYHAILKSEIEDKEAVLNEVSKFCEVKKIQPSLEDVFVKLVEGTSR
jgi:ABC-2 type transport system ATP-binding protein